MKILMDACCSRQMQDWLIAQGYDTTSVLAVDPSMPDEAVIDLARKDNRLVITFDKGFNKRDYLAGADAYRNVLVISAGNGKMRHACLFAILQHIFNTYGDQLDGKFSMYHQGRVKSRN